MRRLGASLVDLLCSVILAGLLASSLGWFLAEQAVDTFRIYDRASAWDGPLPLVIGAISPLVYAWAPAWMLLTASEALWGAGPGKLITRMEILPLSGSGRNPLVRRWLLKSSGGLVFCFGLLAHRWEIVAGGAVVGAAVGALAALSLTGLIRPVLDGWAGTRVTSIR